MPIAGVGVATAIAISLCSVDAIPRDGRQNKKSKWDKESISPVAAHAAILSTANASTGYSAFARKRQERSSEKK